MGRIIDGCNRNMVGHKPVTGKLVKDIADRHTAGVYQAGHLLVGEGHINQHRTARLAPLGG